MFRWPIPLAIVVVVLATAFPACGQNVYPWVLLVPDHDSRDPEMVARDEAQSRGFVSVVSASEKLFHRKLVWSKAPIRRLLGLPTPFCELHFDGIRPLKLTSEEKGVLSEYIKRGGFILCFIDTYPYTESQFWPIKQWDFIDFLTRELPASDPNFTTGKATDAFPIFSFYYHTQTAHAMLHEFEGNPNTPNRTLLYYGGRLCAFVMGEYGYYDDDHWVAIPRPFNDDFSSDPKSYRLMVNIYAYSIAH